MRGRGESDTAVDQHHSVAGRLRILVTCDFWFPETLGGSIRVARESAAALAARGHIVTVVAPRSGDHPNFEEIDLLQVHRITRRYRALPKTYTDPLAAFLALGRFPRGSFDVVLAHHLGSGSAALARRSCDAPTLYLYHASPYREAVYRRQQGVSVRHSLQSRVVEPALRMLEQAVVRSADRVAVLSEFSRSLVLNDHPSAATRVVRLPGGVEIDKYKPVSSRAVVRDRLNIPDEAVVLLTVRRLVPRMGVGLLLEAVASIADRIPHLKLVIVGDGELRDRLEARARALGVAGSTTFLGRISDEALINWYQAADLFVLPSAAYEGFGMVTAEALASGTPVVGTPVGATPELLGPLDDRLVASAATPTAIAETVLSVVQEDVHRDRDRFLAYATETFAWSKSILAWEALLAQLCAHARV